MPIVKDACLDVNTSVCMCVCVCVRTYLCVGVRKGKCYELGILNTRRHTLIFQDICFVDMCFAY